MSEENIKLQQDNYDISKHEYYRKDPDRYKNLGKFLWKSIWHLPFENYDKYYTNGKIFKMTHYEKLEMTIKDSIEKQKYTMFIRIVKLRPNILNNEDMELFEYESNKARKKTYFVLFLLFLNGSFFSYKMALKKDTSLIWTFLAGNTCLLLLYITFKAKENKLYSYLYNKYNKYINYDEMRQVLIDIENKTQ